LEPETINIAIVCGAIVAIGYGLDKLLLRQQQDRIKGKLTNYWVYIDDLKVSDLPSDVASLLIWAFENIFAPKGSSRITIILRVLLTSFALTITCLLLPYLIHFIGTEFYFDQLLDREFSRNEQLTDKEIAVGRTMYSLPMIAAALGNLSLHFLLPINALIDAVSLYVTYKLAIILGIIPLTHVSKYENLTVKGNRHDHPQTQDTI
jgi:hypothetical protein